MGRVLPVAALVILSWSVHAGAQPGSLPSDLLRQEESAAQAHRTSFGEWCRSEVLSQTKQRSTLLQLHDQVSMPDRDAVLFDGLSRASEDLARALERKREEASALAARRSRASVALDDLQRRAAALAAVEDELEVKRQTNGSSKAALKGSLQVVKDLLARARKSQQQASDEMRQGPEHLEDEERELEGQYKSKATDLARLRAQRRAEGVGRQLVLAALEDEDAFMADLQSLCSLGQAAYRRLDASLQPELHGAAKLLAERPQPAAARPAPAPPAPAAPEAAAAAAAEAPGAVPGAGAAEAPRTVPPKLRKQVTSAPASLAAAVPPAQLSRGAPAPAPPPPPRAPPAPAPRRPPGPGPGGAAAASAAGPTAGEAPPQPLPQAAPVQAAPAVAAAAVAPPTAVAQAQAPPRPLPLAAPVQAAPAVTAAAPAPPVVMAQAQAPPRPLPPAAPVQAATAVTAAAAAPPVAMAQAQAPPQPLPSAAPPVAVAQAQAPPQPMPSAAPVQAAPAVAAAAAAPPVAVAQAQAPPQPLPSAAPVQAAPAVAAAAAAPPVAVAQAQALPQPLPPAAPVQVAPAVAVAAAPPPVAVAQVQAASAQSMRSGSLQQPVVQLVPADTSDGAVDALDASGAEIQATPPPGRRKHFRRVQDGRLEEAKEIHRHLRSSGGSAQPGGTPRPVPVSTDSSDDIDTAASEGALPAVAQKVSAMSADTDSSPEMPAWSPERGDHLKRIEKDLNSFNAPEASPRPPPASSFQDGGHMSDLRGGWQSLVKKKRKSARKHVFNDQTTRIADLVQTPTTYTAWHPEHSDAALAASAKSELLAAERAFDDDRPAALIQLGSIEHRTALEQRLPAAAEGPAAVDSPAAVAGLLLERYGQSLGSAALLQLSRARLDAEGLRRLAGEVQAPGERGGREAQAVSWCRDFEREAAQRAQADFATRVMAAANLTEVEAEQHLLAQEAAVQEGLLKVFHQGSKHLETLLTQVRERASSMLDTIHSLQKDAQQFTAPDQFGGLHESLGRAEGLATSSMAEVEDLITAALSRRQEAEKSRKTATDQLRDRLAALERQRAGLAAGVERGGEGDQAGSLRAHYDEICKWTLEDLEAKRRKDEAERDAIHAALAVLSAH